MTENEEKPVAEKEKKEPSFFKAFEDFKREVKEDMEKYNMNISDKLEAIFSGNESAKKVKEEMKKEVKPASKEKIETQKKKKKVLFGKVMKAHKKAGD